ncbi:hypothetical protein BDZ91DRAFT_486604 [Kalaharituber pfeilii]|nr:hypothetical protein BDZ91DRAFT_486604 [Kalaharituber pfeilii]
MGAKQSHRRSVSLQAQAYYSAPSLLPLVDSHIQVSVVSCIAADRNQGNDARESADPDAQQEIMPTEATAGQAAKTAEGASKEEQLWQPVRSRRRRSSRCKVHAAMTGIILHSITTIRVRHNDDKKQNEKSTRTYTRTLAEGPSPQSSLQFSLSVQPSLRRTHKPSDGTTIPPTRISLMHGRGARLTFLQQ